MEDYKTVSKETLTLEYDINVIQNTSTGKFTYEIRINNIAILHCNDYDNAEDARRAAIKYVCPANWYLYIENS